MPNQKETLTIIEQIVNEHALKLAQKMRLPLKEGSFRIEFVEDSAHETILIPGSCVIIRTRVAPSTKDFNTYIRGWLKAAVKLYAVSDLARKDGVYSLQDRKLSKLSKHEKESDIFPTLLPKSQLKIEIFTHIVVTNIVTGSCVERESAKASTESMIEDARLELTRIAEFVSAEEIEVEADSEDDTPDSENVEGESNA